MLELLDGRSEAQADDDHVGDMRTAGLILEAWRASSAARLSPKPTLLSWTDGSIALFVHSIEAGSLDIRTRTTDALIAIVIRLEDDPERAAGLELVSLPSHARFDIGSRSETISMVLLLKTAALATICGTAVELLPTPFRLAAAPGRGGRRSLGLPYGAERLARQLLRSAEESCFTPLFLRAKAIELLSLLLEHWQAEDACSNAAVIAPNDRDGVERVRRIMIQDPSITRPVDELARIACMNRTKLRFLFKRLCGTTLFDFRMSMLMDQADRMLRMSSLSIAEIGYRLGYANPSGFNVAYQRYYGRTPGWVRRNL